jgi:GTP-binding protein
LIVEKVIKVLSRNGLERTVLNSAFAGDIVSIAGFSKASVTATLCDPELQEPIKVRPTRSM